MKLRFTPRALENIVAIADYIRAHNPAAAQRVRSAIYESLRFGAGHAGTRRLFQTA